MGRTKLKNKTFFYFLILELVFSSFLFGNTKQVIKVGYFKIDNYYSVDYSGKICGYDVDYLDKISDYTDYVFEFVDCSTWIDAVKLLEQHKIDLVGVTQRDPIREEQYEFCINPYGYTLGEIVTLPGNSIPFEDFEELSKLKIGYLQNYVHISKIKEVFKDHNIEPKLKSYKMQQDLINALQNKEVGAIASYSHMLNQEYPVVAKFFSAPFFFISWKGNKKLIDNIDNALISINIDDPSFDDSLCKKYFSFLKLNSLSREEINYLHSIDSLTFCFCTNEGYLCRTENNCYVGINPATAHLICKQLGLKYKEVQFNFAELINSLASISNGKQSGQALVEKVKSMGIDIWGDFYFDHNWADTLGVGITRPYLDATYYEVQRRGAIIDYASSKISLTRGLRFTAELANKYKPEQIVWCNDFEDCLNSVRSGEADFTVINTYAAEYYLSKYQFNNLSTTLINFSNKSCMAIVDGSNELLTSIVNKTLQYITSFEMSEIIRTETTKQPKQNNFLLFIYTNFALAIVLVAIGLFIVFSFISLLIIVKRSKRQNEILLKATQAKSDFLSKMSHDIRTPMNAIINLTKMVESEIDDKKTALSDIKKIKNSNEFLLSLINDVLDVSRIEQGKLVLKRQMYNSSEFLDYLHATFDKLALEKNITFSISLNKQDVWIYTDCVRLNQVFFNLISNAIKYTQKNGNVSVDVKFGKVVNGVLPTDIHVVDNGIGMSKEFLAKAFKAFEQENRLFMSVEGTGLGLSIVKEIVDVMNGKINISSVMNEGTDVYVHFDFGVPSKNDIENFLKSSVKLDLFYNIEGLTILVAEDNSLNMQITKRILENKKINVLCASNGLEAIKIFKENANKIDVILMDIRMPIMNGFEATEKIRHLEIEKAKTIPIIAMTANAYEEDVKKCLDIGMNYHIAKPIEPNKLYDVISKQSNFISNGENK